MFVLYAWEDMEAVGKGKNTNVTSRKASEWKGRYGWVGKGKYTNVTCGKDNNTNVTCRKESVWRWEDIQEVWRVIIQM